MGRREFLLGAGYSAAVPALPIDAQAAKGSRRIAILMGMADDSVNQRRVAAFRQGLRSLGWESRNQPENGRALNVKISPSLLATADELID